MKRSTLPIFCALALMIPANAVAADSTLEGYGGESGAVLKRALEGLKDSGGSTRGGSGGTANGGSGGEITGGRSFGTALGQGGSSTGGGGTANGGAGTGSGSGSANGGTGSGSNGSGGNAGGSAANGGTAAGGTAQGGPVRARQASSTTSPGVLPFSTRDVVLLLVALAALVALGVALRSMPRPAQDA